MLPLRSLFSYGLFALPMAMLAALALLYAGFGLATIAHHCWGAGADAGTLAARPRDGHARGLRPGRRDRRGCRFTGLGALPVAYTLLPCALKLVAAAMLWRAPLRDC